MNTYRHIVTIGFLILFIGYARNLKAQSSKNQQTFTHADTLRGTITPQRAWWDVTFYDLYTSIHPADSTIEGHTTIYYRVTKSPQKMQIDLQQPLQVDKMVQAGQKLNYTRDGNAFFVDMPGGLKQGSIYNISVYYHGKPKVAKNPPWDGGFIWKQDSLGHPWVATANQGLGASVWWPNKDHLSDEPDSMAINITVPDPMVDVSNGRLRKKTPHDEGTTTWSWFVSNPINNYDAAVNAGNYVNFTDTFNGEKGPLDLSYWVLKQHLGLAQKQFKQVKPMLRCFENWFGPYPFYKDSYKLVEAPHLGMEHQSAVAYGNRFKNGYLGRDLSGTGQGLKWDFIIVHESGHEWWGNSITAKDLADMWVHEGFTSYAEDLYVECQYGKKAGQEYARGLRKNVRNGRPIIAHYGVNEEGSGDMYYKANNMLNMIREIIGDDAKWKSILHGLQKTFYHQTVTSKQIEDYINKRTKYDLSSVFDQYLRDTQIPTLQYYIGDDHTLYYRWATAISSFNMPVKVQLNSHSYSFIQPQTDQWRTAALHLDDDSNFNVDKNFYVKTDSLTSKPPIK